MNNKTIENIKNIKKSIKILRILKKHYKVKSMLKQLSNLGTFKVLIATILSQRARDEQTLPIARRLFEKYKTPKQLAYANKKDVERIIKSIGFYHNKASAIINVSRIIHEKHKGKVPKDYETLLSLPKVGRKTAGCVIVYGHGKKAIPVDTHVHRISNRIGLVNTKSPEKTEIELLKIIPKKYWHLVNELFVNHGRAICRPVSPRCNECPIRRLCNYGVKLNK